MIIARLIADPETLGDNLALAMEMIEARDWEVAGAGMLDTCEDVLELEVLEGDPAGIRGILDQCFPTSDLLLSQGLIDVPGLFVSDMDGQLRQTGLGDLVVGKHVGKLMGALGGRIDAFRAGLAETSDSVLIAAIERNVTFGDSANPGAVAAEMRVLSAALAGFSGPDLLAGKIARGGLIEVPMGVTIREVVEEIGGFRKRAQEFEENPELVRNIVAEGGEKAREAARATLDDVRRAMNLRVD